MPDRWLSSTCFWVGRLSAAWSRRQWRSPARRTASGNRPVISAQRTTIIVICVTLGAITAAIGQKKNLPVGQSFALGALLGIFGAIIVICQRPGLPKAPRACGR